MKKVVIFDFDKTLTTRDTFKIWIACVFYFFPHRVILCLNIILLMKIYKEPEKLQLLKNKLFSKLISNLHINQIDKISDRFRKRTVKFLRFNLLEAIKEHIDKNHIVYVVTASSELAISKLLEEHRVQVVGAQFEEKNNRLTGRLVRDGCYGKFKVSEFFLRIKGTQNIDFEIIESWSDSISDWPIMRLAKNRYWIDTGGEVNAIRKIDPNGTVLRL